MQSRISKESATAKVSPAPIRFVEKHAYAQPSAKELMATEHPLEPIAGVSTCPCNTQPAAACSEDRMPLCLSP